MRASTLSRPEIPLHAEPPAEPPNIQNAESSAEDLEISRVENLCLLADGEWLPFSASQIPSLTDLDLTPPPSVFHCRRRNSLLRLSARFVSAESSAAPLPSQSSVAPVPLSQSLALALNLGSPRLPRTDGESEIPLHLAPVRKKSRVLVPITSGAIVTSRYGGYCFAINSRDSSNSEPKPPRVAHCCIVVCRVPQSQSSRDPHDELLVKKISARDSSNTFVALPTAENEIAYSTHCFRFSSFNRCKVKQFGVHCTYAR